MANQRQTFQFTGRMQRSTIDLFAKVTIGATGAPTLTADSKGVTSITRNSAGQYTVVLQDTYAMLIGYGVSMYSGTSAQAAPFNTLEADSISTNGTFVIQFRAVDNSTATDPASGEIMYINLTLRNTRDA